MNLGDPRELLAGDGRRQGSRASPGDWPVAWCLGYAFRRRQPADRRVACHVSWSDHVAHEAGVHGLT